MENGIIDLKNPLQKLFIKTFNKKTADDLKWGLDIKSNSLINQSYSSPGRVNIKIQDDKRQFPTERKLNNDGKLRISVKSTENCNILNMKFENVDSSKHFQQTNFESAKEDNGSKLIKRNRMQKEETNTMCLDEADDKRMPSIISDLQKEIHTFGLKHEEKQESILIKEKIENKELELKIPIGDINNNIESVIQNDIAQIIDNLINYVEIKEIAESLIKEDENFHENFSENVIPPEKPKDDTRKRLSGKLTRTSRELKKLNCKMITVDVESNKTEDICLKPYCKLGCICNSLRCNTLIGLHCRQSKCIFQCICSHNKYIVNIPSSIDAPYLSSDAVSVIENEAKKNLAKEEKEFTQTVIYTNERAIVVGTANKKRRVIKAPKKYMDFYDNEFFEAKSLVTKKSQFVKQLFIEVEDYDIPQYFSQINNS
ncbi:hypothetical protein ABEB36_005312 [Hypothenemus hampei]|uniref:MGA conserved domain-containing protein n=1 Tax=Hypothenemus hampei TaxID=57062 RepID=A0ABD1EYV5_HYPHA